MDYYEVTLYRYDFHRERAGDSITEFCERNVDIRQPAKTLLQAIIKRELLECDAALRWKNNGQLNRRKSSYSTEIRKRTKAETSRILTYDTDNEFILELVARVGYKEDSTVSNLTAILYSWDEFWEDEVVEN